MEMLARPDDATVAADLTRHIKRFQRGAIRLSQASRRGPQELHVMNEGARHNAPPSRSALTRKSQNPVTHKGAKFYDADLLFYIPV